MALGWHLWALIAALTLAPLHEARAASLSGRSRQNPIRKVVNMLKALEKKVADDGKKAEASFQKYMCFCKDGESQLQTQIRAAEAKIPQLESRIKEATASHQQLSQDVAQHQKDRADARTAMETAALLREKGASAFAEKSAGLKANIKALTSAIAAIDGKGTSSGGFLQTTVALVLRKLSLTLDMSTADRDVLSSFLSGGGAEVGEISGILKQMLDDMSQDLTALLGDEKAEVASYESLVSAKRKEVLATSKAIEEKTARVGDLALEITTLQNDLEDTKDGLSEDQNFVTHIQEMCETKKAKWTVYQKTMAEELAALSETINLLNDDDALDLFKKTLPSPAVTAASFLQLRSGRPQKATAVRFFAAAMLDRVRKRDRRLDLLERALRGQTAGYEAIQKKVDELVAILGQEQRDDDAKKAFCNAEIGKTEDDKTAAERMVSDRGTVIAQSEDTLAALSEEISKLVKGIQELDREVASQTQLRKEKHADVVATLAANNAAKNLLEVAKNRLAQFYNPKLRKASHDSGRSEEDAAPGALLSQFVAPQGALGAPEADLSYTKKHEESHDVVAMLDLLSADLDKETIQLEEQDKDAQQDYEMFIKDSSEKRMLDSKAIADKEGAKAELEATLHEDKEALRSEKANLGATKRELLGLHGDCDWLLQNFDLRKRAREEEADALEKAKAVLSGANYS